jgi:hypothetical protein
LTRQHAFIAAALLGIGAASAAVLVGARPAASDRPVTTVKAAPGTPAAASTEDVARRTRIEALVGGFVQAPVSLKEAASSRDALGERVCGTFHTFRFAGLRGFDVWFYPDGEAYLAVSPRRPCPEGETLVRDGVTLPRAAR